MSYIDACACELEGHVTDDIYASMYGQEADPPQRFSESRLDCIDFAVQGFSTNS